MTRYVGDRRRAGHGCARSVGPAGRRGERGGVLERLDEQRVEDSIVLIARSDTAAAGWQLERVTGRFRAPDLRTSDGEALARHDSFVYVVGSHFGSEDDGLQARRAFVARFREADVVERPGAGVDLEVWRSPFALHRLINDALRDRAIELFPISDDARRAFIDATAADGHDDVLAGDWPVNVEGVASARRQPARRVALAGQCSRRPARRRARRFRGGLPARLRASAGDGDLGRRTGRRACIAGGHPRPGGRTGRRGALRHHRLHGPRAAAPTGPGADTGLQALDGQAPARRSRWSAHAHARAVLSTRAAAPRGLARRPDGGYVYMTDDEDRVTILVADPRGGID